MIVKVEPGAEEQPVPAWAGGEPLGQRAHAARRPPGQYRHGFVLYVQLQHTRK